jgi:hypothetical protein
MAFLKKPVLSAIAFFGTLLALSVGYAALSSGLTTADLSSTGSMLRSASWNRLVNSVLELDTRTAPIASTGGNVGIGTPTPWVGLHVLKNNGSGFATWFAQDSSSAGVGIGTSGSGGMVQGLSNVGGAASLSLQPQGGNVGIATNTPNASYKLDVNGAINATALYVNGTAVSGGGLGVGQTWQDLTCCRAFGTTYTNTTGKPISVMVTTNMGQYHNVYAVVGGVVAAYTHMGTTPGYTAMPSITFIVPPSASYYVTSSYSPTITYWSELR